MTEIKSFPIAGHVSSPTGIKFLRVEWWDDSSRFVVVRLTSGGKEDALRMDLNKRVFLDHLDDPLMDEAVQNQTLPIWNLVARERTRSANAG